MSCTCGCIECKPELFRDQSKVAKIPISNTDNMLAELRTWINMYGETLIPGIGFSDTYGDGIRSAKDQVKRILNGL